NQILIQHGKTLNDYNSPIPESTYVEMQNKIYQNDEGYQYNLLNDDQRKIVDHVLNLINNRNTTAGRLIFMDGSGGTGKTFTYNCLTKILKLINQKFIF